MSDVIEIAGPEDGASLEHLKNDILKLKHRLDGLNSGRFFGEEADKFNAQS